MLYHVESFKTFHAEISGMVMLLWIRSLILKPLQLQPEIEKEFKYHVPCAWGYISLFSGSKLGDYILHVYGFCPKL